MVIVNGEFFGLLFLLVVFGVIPFLLLQRAGDRTQLGIVECLRCGHVGKTAGRFVPMVGLKSVCANCRSDNWRSKPADPPAEPAVAASESVGWLPAWIVFGVIGLIVAVAAVIYVKQ